METEPPLSYLDQRGVTANRSKATACLAQQSGPEKVGDFLERIDILEQKSHSEGTAKVDTNLEDCRFECFHHLIDGQSSTAPHAKRLDRHRRHTPFDAVFEDGCQTPANIAPTACRIGLEIVDNGLICPVRLFTAAPKQEVPTKGQRTMLCNGQIGRVKPVLRVQIENPATRHDQVTVFLNNHRVRLQSSSKGLDYVEVQSKAIGVGHTPV